MMKDVKGDLEEHKNKGNLTKEESKSKASLLKGVKDGELVVNMTDKSRKALVCKPDTYRRSINAHTDMDMEVDDKYLKEIKMNCHLRSLKRLTGMELNHPGAELKLSGAITNQFSEAPIIYNLCEDHKKDFIRKLHTRPVCDGRRDPLSRASDGLGTLQNALIEGDSSRKPSCRSTEESQ